LQVGSRSHYLASLFIYPSLPCLNVCHSHRIFHPLAYTLPLATLKVEGGHK
jgi:hypothetical protein